MRKLLCSAVALGVLASTTLTPIAYADVAANALPTLAPNGAINADVTTTGNNMNVQITAGSGGVGTLNWTDYYVGSDSTVNYEFTAHNQTALNRVVGNNMAQIYGKITNSGYGCANCHYETSSKVILINPNGVLFGDGANVNLNSFTVSTMNGNYNEGTNKLELNGLGEGKIYIGEKDGDVVNIYGDKGVTMASNKEIRQYSGSKISTNIGYNDIDNTGNRAAYGKVKLVTADGVNFTYYDNGAVTAVDGVKSSNKRMYISLNGDIESGHIDVRNASSYKVEGNDELSSAINLKGASLKATKLYNGNDGNIWLTADNDIISENTTYTTASGVGSETRVGGNVKFDASNKVSLGSDRISSAGNIIATSSNHDVNVDHTAATATGDINLTAKGYASAQNGSNLIAKNININAGQRAQVVTSKANATQNVKVISSGDLAWVNNSDIDAGNDIDVKAANGYILTENSTLDAAGNINLLSKDSITSVKLADSTFTANKINLTSNNESVLLNSTAQFRPTVDLNLKAAKNVEINSQDSLTTAKTNIDAGENVYLTSANGSVTLEDSTNFINAKKINVIGHDDVVLNNVNLKNIKTNIQAGRDVTATVEGVANRNNGLVAVAGNDMVVTTNGTLSVSKLVSGNNMTINADNVISGYEKTSSYLETEGDSSDRAYIEVGGEFKSNVNGENYTITKSGDRTSDGRYNRKHHIQYGTDEKILLVNKRPVENNPTDPNIGDIDNAKDRDIIEPGDINDNTDITDPVDPVDPVNPDPVDPNPGEGCDDPINRDDVVDEPEPGSSNISGQNLMRFVVNTNDQSRE